MTIAKHWISALLISFILLPLLLQAADRSWTQVNPLPPAGSSNSLQDAVWGNGKFVAVGGLGIIMTSTDGANWTAKPSTSAAHLNSIAWSGSKFVAAGAGGIVLTSDDGTAWTQQESGVSVDLYSVIWDSTNSRFIAAGLAESLIKGTVLTSTDGVAWSRKTPPFGFTILGLATDGARIVAAATSNVILTSTDSSGDNWQKTYQGSNTNTQLYDATLNGSQFLVAGDNGTILESLDGGTTWSSLTSGTTNDLRAINSANGVIIAVGGTNSSGTITRSTDGGASWIATPVGNGRLRAITPDTNNPAVFSALGTNSLLYNVTNNGDKDSWINTTSGTSNNLTGLTWTGTQFAASSDTNKVYLSNDGIDWSSSPALATGVAGIRNITWDSSSNPGRYIILEASSILACQNLACTSPIYTRPDSKALNGIAWNGPNHVVVGDSGFAAYSPNDSSWIEASAPTIENLNGVIWDGSRYIAVGDNGTIFTSSDNGATWNVINAQTVADLGNTFNSEPLIDHLFDISWNGSQYVAVSSGKVFLSHEGIFWEESNLASITTNINGVIWDNTGSRFISVGDGGVILASTGPDLSVQLFPDKTPATESFLTEYTARVSSIGDFDAFSATLTIDLVNNAQFQDSSKNSACTGCSPGSSQFTFNLGNIKTGSQSAPITFIVFPSSTGTMTVKASTRAGILETDIINNKTTNTIKVQSIGEKLAGEINPISNVGGGAIGYFWMLMLLPFAALRFMRR